MMIYQLNLKCFHMDRMKDFYTKVLEMELIVESDRDFAVMAGTTKIVFEKVDSLPFYHVCFRTSAVYYEYIFRKIGKESVLLPNERGEYSMFWNGKQAYFLDPDGNVLEMLERQIEGAVMNNPGWHDVGEIGLPVHNVREMQQELNSYLSDEQKNASETFAFYGDKKGVFVVVKEGRHWYPTERGSEISPIKLHVSGEKDAHFTSNIYPYEIVVRKEWVNTVSAVQFRIARPTNQLERLVHFYEKGLGLNRVGEFSEHEGYKGLC